MHSRYDRHIFVEHGGDGGCDKRSEAGGKDVYIDVPCGTVVYSAETGKYICDVTEDGQEVLLLRGGGGGLGNLRFRIATNQTPRYVRPGEPTQGLTITLELKLLADVDLVGFPNVDKSTLVSAISGARPKVVSYPFTTLEPLLGAAKYRDRKSFVMANILGITEGASEGKGFGLRFLWYIERNSLLLFMVPGDTDDIKREYDILLNELRTFNPGMMDKHRVLAVTRCDLLGDEFIKILHETLSTDLPMVFISATTGKGLNELKDILRQELSGESNRLKEVITRDNLVRRDKDPDKFVAELADEGEFAEIEYVNDGELNDVVNLEDLEYEGLDD